jgi:hypothetical protein
VFPLHFPPRVRSLAVGLILTVALGVASRRYPIGLHLYDKSLGDALYAVAAYLTLALTRPRWRPFLVAVTSLGFCLAVEAFQLTGVPARHAHLGPIRWLLGTQFSWSDIGWYLAGIAGVASVDGYLTSGERARLGSRRSPDPDERRPPEG